MSMNVGLTNDLGYMDMVRKDFKPTEKKNTAKAETPVYRRDASEGISEKNEAKLSSKAQSLLKSLRRLYGDFDFFVGNKSDDLNALSKSGSQEFSVIFSNEELERMASDSKYAKEKIQAMERAVSMSKKISEQSGQLSELVNSGDLGGMISKISITVDDKGNTKIFAELEKASEKQKEQIEKGREKRAEEKKKAEKKAEKEAQTPVKRTSVEAGSVEELIEKIRNVNWDTVPEARPGKRFDFTV